MLCRTIAGQRVDITNPAILALVDALGLSPGKRPLFFCERVRLNQAYKRQQSLILCRELAKRNRKYSRYTSARLV